MGVLPGQAWSSYGAQRPHRAKAQAPVDRPQQELLPQDLGGVPTELGFQPLSGQQW